MTFEEARSLFLELHIPGEIDIYIHRPTVGGMCAGDKEFFPHDFEIKEFCKKDK